VAQRVRESLTARAEVPPEAADRPGWRDYLPASPPYRAVSRGCTDRRIRRMIKPSLSLAPAMVRSLRFLQWYSVAAGADHYFAEAQMIKRTLGSVVVGAWLIASGSVQAHHSLAGVYDIKKEGQVSGTLTKVAFTNPHGAMHLAVKNTDGTTTEYIMTTGSANTLANLGFGGSGPNTVKAGDAVTIKYFPARNGKPLGFIRSITLADQREVQISSGSSED
jgi:hypothetical protein